MAKIPKGQTGQRREQILAEAQQLFIAHGPHHVSTRQIARAVGISQPSLYAHFPTRDAISAELCCRAFDELHACLTAAAAAVDEGDARARLHRLGREYIDFGMRHEAAYRVAFMLEMPSDHDPVKSRVLAAGLRAFGVLRDLFLSIAGAQPLVAETAAQSAWASMHGLVALLLARREFPWVDHDMLIDVHLTRLCAAAIPVDDPVGNSSNLGEGHDPHVA